MRLQVVLTPAESKRLIAKAVKNLPMIQQALREGTIIVDKSTTNAYVLNELIEEKVDVSWYSSGIIIPEGTCLTSKKGVLNARILVKGIPQEVVQSGSKRRSTIYREWLETMDEKDVFIKSANALDPNWNAAVLAGTTHGGIIARILPVLRRRKVNLLVPVGLEKVLPIAIKDAQKEAGLYKIDDAMGMPCMLVPTKGGTVITELEAIKILTGTEAVPIAAGGVSGAEGAVTLVIRGTDEQIQMAKDLLLEIKGEKPSMVLSLDCPECPRYYSHYQTGPTTPRPCPGFWKYREKPK